MFNSGLFQSSVSTGWSASRSRPWPIILVMLGLFVFCLVLHFLVVLTSGEKSSLATFSGALNQILSIIFVMGFQAYSLKAVDLKYPDWNDLFWGLRFPFRIFAADILGSFPFILVVFLGGFLWKLSRMLGLSGESPVLIRYGVWGGMGTLCAGLAVYSYIRLNQWSFLLIDHECGALESVKKSWTLMRGHTLTLTVLLIFLLLVNCLGAIALLIGLFVSIPFSFAALAAFYRAISKKTVDNNVVCGQV